MLLAFLGVFLLFLILFHGVLFPFLMAIFIAYLIEPLVARITRSRLLGVRWTRGPTIVVLYVLGIGGLVMLGIAATTNVVARAKELTLDVAQGLKENAERARFTIEPTEAKEGQPATEGFPQDVRIPAGVRVVLMPWRAPEARGPAPQPRVYVTHYDLIVPAGDTRASMLLDVADETVPRGAKVGTILDADRATSVDDGPVPDAAARLRAEIDTPAEGLEVLLERRLITPVVQNLAKAGVHLDPGKLRALLAAQARGVSEDLPEKISSFGRNFVAKVALSIYELVLILMLTAFIVMDRKRISEFFASLPPPRLLGEYRTLLRYVDRGLAGVIRGQLVICGANGTLTWIGLTFIQVKGALLLAIVAGILSLIPIFGTILSSVPIVLLALTDGIDKGLLALVWILMIHLIEANLLNPLIMGSHARMHPVIIVFALLAGEHAFGVWGALLAVPTASIVQACFLYYRHEVEGIPFTPPQPHTSWIARWWRARRAAVGKSEVS